MQDFEFRLPTEIYFGKGISQIVGRAAKKLGATKVLIVSDKGVINAGLTKPVENSLNMVGIPYIYHDNLNSNPRIWQCEEGYEVAKKEGIDCLVAVGGGTSMDAAKAIGTLLTHGGKVRDWVGFDKLKTRITPLICIPTTAGTGSEVTPDAVITDTDKRVKLDIFDTKVAPWIALLDPDVLLNLPKRIMASTGVDALTHAVEAYTCKRATPVTDSFALRAIDLISTNIRKAVLHRDPEAISAMMIGSTLAGLSFGYSDVAADHCMAQALGGLYDVSHGVACAVFLTVVSEFNIPACPARYAEIAKHMGVDIRGMTEIEAAYASVAAMQAICDDLGIAKFSELETVDPKDFAELAQASFDCVSTPSNPREITVNDFLELFKKAYYG